MAQYEEWIESSILNEGALIKSNDYLTFQERKRKKFEIRAKKEQKLKTTENCDIRNHQRTKEIQKNNSILRHTLNVDDKINREAIKLVDNFRQFNETKIIDKESYISDGLDQIRFLTKIFSGGSTKKKLLEEWEKMDNLYKLKNKKDKDEYEKEKIKFQKELEQQNKRLEEIRVGYENGKDKSIIDYFYLVLERSNYPNGISPNYDLYFQQDSKLLVLDIQLPTSDSISNVKSFTVSKGSVVSKNMPKREFENYYNNILYQVIIRTFHEMFESDYLGYIDIVTINGYVQGMDRKLGKEINNCILSAQTERNEFEKINLKNIELEYVKECFKGLKGISAGSLINLSPVKPIMKVNKVDKRIIESNEIVDEIGDQNLATMDRQDFEVLVRDLFAKEFNHKGCTVKVTQASRDAGVDAIAFDEDPIRGGKFVIQAKRYNNLVPLTAVRDLYGTVMNEGAVKGILVTTSYYGKDSLEFVKDKPLTLINGEELLFMFNKHGYKFQIELQNKKAHTSKISY